jgi:hypothetical protein
LLRIEFFRASPCRMERFPYLLLSFLTAMLTALLLAAIARYDMGMSREAIRIVALSVAGFIFAAVVVVVLFKRR